MGWFTSKVKVVEKPSPPDKTPYDKFLEARAHLPNCGTCRWWCPNTDTYGDCAKRPELTTRYTAVCVDHTPIPPKPQDEVVVEPSECEVLRARIAHLEQDNHSLRLAFEVVDNARDKFLGLLIRIKRIVGFTGNAVDLPDAVLAQVEELKKLKASHAPKAKPATKKKTGR